MRESYDVLIVGGGIVGVAIGLELIETLPNLKIAIAEKEISGLMHASGRNSGVMHAGFYYTPDSLKAKFCKDGNYLLKKYCKKKSLKCDEIGKVVVSSSQENEKQLDLLAERAHSNNVDIEILNVSKLKKYEPMAKTYARFLWSPKTAIADPIEIHKAMISDFLMLGGNFLSKTKIELAEVENEIRIVNKDFYAKYIINAAGTHSLSLAKSLNIATEFKLIPFKGTYIGSKKMSHSLSRLVYPLPHPLNPFLGIHLTKTINGVVKIGPSAIPTFGPEKYKILDKFALQEAKESFTGLLTYALNDSRNARPIFFTETKYLFTKGMLNEAEKIVPDVKKFSDWRKLKSGIRAQLLNLNSKSLEQDFIVVNKLNSTHILNLVSPGWTCSMSFAKYISNQFILPNLGK